MNYEEIQKLIETMGNSKLDTLSIEFPDGVKINMKKKEEVGKILPEGASIHQKQEKKEENEKDRVITSPMVGTFYTKASPEEKEFVQVGDKVKKGQVLCIIEAMKLMNEIEAEQEGEIMEIYVKNEEMVEFGDPLFRIRENN